MMNDSLGKAMEILDSNIDKKNQVIQSLDALSKTWDDKTSLAGRELLAMRELLEHDVHFLKEIRELLTHNN